MKKLLIAVVLTLLVLACVKKMKDSREAEWHGLTEGEARSKLDEKLPHRIPDEKRSEISDKIVAKMRDRGILAEEAETASEPSVGATAAPV